jgi:riboflavin synthase
MFTGLVRAIGRLERCPHGVKVHLEAPGSLGAIALGDSVAVDGICLTVAECLGETGAAAGFRADVSEETLRRSLLGARAQAGQRVNLEPALRLSDRLGGHLVSGHVDGLGTVRAIQRQPASWRLELAWHGPLALGNDLVARLLNLGYVAKPFVAERAEQSDKAHENFLHLKFRLLQGKWLGYPLLN